MSQVRAMDGPFAGTVVDVDFIGRWLYFPGFVEEREKRCYDGVWYWHYPPYRYKVTDVNVAPDGVTFTAHFAPTD